MKSLLATTALLALLGTAPAFAEDPAPIKDQPTANDVIPDANAPAATPDKPAVAPDSATKPDASGAPAMKSQDQVQTPAPADSKTAAAPTEKFLTEQTETEWLASSLVGSTVYNEGDENLGDVNDVILADGGSVPAVIIGVGGFLGIGEKNVAVAFSELAKSTDANGQQKFILKVSKEELDAAPAFITLAEKERQKAAPPDDSALNQPPPAPSQ